MLFLESGTTGSHSTTSISARRSNATMTQTMAMNMGMSKSGAETAEELKLSSSLKHALHPSVLEEAMPRIAGPSTSALHPSVLPKAGANSVPNFSDVDGR
jgi:hypothetical protein